MSWVEVTGEHRERVTKILASLPNKPLYSTRGVYPNGDFKSNAVRAQDMANHLGYNLRARQGRALLIDGKCVYAGNVGPEVISKHEGELAANPTIPTQPTPPYV